MKRFLIAAAVATFLMAGCEDMFSSDTTEALDREKSEAVEFGKGAVCDLGVILGSAAAARLGIPLGEVETAVLGRACNAAISAAVDRLPISATVADTKLGEACARFRAVAGSVAPEDRPVLDRLIAGGCA